MYYAGFNGRKLAVHLAYENGKYEVHVSGKQQSLDFLWPIRSIGSEYPKEHGTICNLRGLLQGRRTFDGCNFRVSGLLIRDQHWEQSGLHCLILFQCLVRALSLGANTWVSQYGDSACTLVS